MIEATYYWDLNFTQHHLQIIFFRLKLIILASWVIGTSSDVWLPFGNSKWTWKFPPLNSNGTNVDWPQKKGLATEDSFCFGNVHLPVTSTTQAYPWINGWSLDRFSPVFASVLERPNCLASGKDTGHAMIWGRPFSWSIGLPLHQILQGTSGFPGRKATSLSSHQSEPTWSCWKFQA